MGYFVGEENEFKKKETRMRPRKRGLSWSVCNKLALVVLITHNTLFVPL